LADAEAAVDRARALVSDVVEAGRGDADASSAARATQLQHAYENGIAARSHGRRTNPFEDPYGADWPGRREFAEAWSRGRDDWEARHTIGPAGFPGQRSGLAVLEVRLGASLDHRRRMLEHQERVEAERRSLAAQPSEPQLKIPLIGEVRRLEPSPPKRRRPRSIKGIQPKLGES
jgi:hypothetical protein